MNDTPTYRFKPAKGNKDIEHWSLEEFLALDIDEENNMLADGVLKRTDGKFWIYGLTGVYKSFLIAELCFALAAGTDWLGIPVEGGPYRTMYMQGEVPKSEFKNRMRQLYKKYPEAEGNIAVSYLRNWKANQRRDMQTIVDIMEKHQPDFFVFDPITEIYAGSEIDDEAARQFVDNISGVMLAALSSYGGTHHSRKYAHFHEGEGVDVPGGQDMRGSSVFSGWADTIFRVAREKAANTVKVRCEKNRNGPEPEDRTVMLDVDEASPTYLTMVPAATSPHVVARKLLKDGPLTMADFDSGYRKITGDGVNKTRDERKRLVKKGLIYEDRDPIKRRKVIYLKEEA